MNKCNLCKYSIADGYRGYWCKLKRENFDIEEMEECTQFKEVGYEDNTSSNGI